MRAAIGMGSNQGDRLFFLARARQFLEALPFCQEFHASKVFETAAVDCVEPDPFLNAVLVFETTMTAGALLLELHRIEAELGRERTYRNAPRPIDLDLLLLGDEISHIHSVRLPHPRMHLRRFVLEPLVEVAPTMVHPILGKTVESLFGDLCLLETDPGLFRPATSQWPDGLF